MMTFFTVMDGDDGKAVLARDRTAIAGALRDAGVSACATTWRASAQECLDAFRMRRDIGYIAGAGADSDVFGTYGRTNPLPSRARMVIRFVALLLWEELTRRLERDRMKQGRAEDGCGDDSDLDVGQVLAGLDSVGCLVRNSTGSVLVREVTPAQ